jgi:hypothetical protein
MLPQEITDLMTYLEEESFEPSWEDEILRLIQFGPTLVPMATIKVFPLLGMNVGDVSSCATLMVRMKAHPYPSAKH